MAKKLSVKNYPTGQTVGETAPTVIDGVRETAGSLRNPNNKAAGGREFWPIVDEHCLEAQDANDGKHDGTQDSFSMPSFANGTDKRHRGN